MCDADFVTELLSLCGDALEDESHLLHSPCQYLLERLTAQKLSPHDLRTFLRLGHPLASLSEDQLDPRFNEAAAHEELLAPGVAAVAVAGRRVGIDIYKHDARPEHLQEILGRLAEVTAAA